MKDRYVVGLDLGTTTTSLVYFDFVRELKKTILFSQFHNGNLRGE